MITTDTTEKKAMMFQWIRGDRMGQIVKSIDTVVDDNMEFFVFEDGSQCNTQLLGEWIVPIESIHDAPMMVNEFQNLQMIKDQGGRMERVETTATPIVKVVEPAPSVNPIHDLLKMSKKKSVKLQLTVSVEMPAEELIKVIQESYANGSKLIGDYLISSVDQSSVMKQIDSILRSKVDEVTKKKRTAKNETNS